MEALLLLALGALLGSVLVLLLRRRSGAADATELALSHLQQQVSDLIRTLHDTRHHITQETGSQLQSGTKALTDLVQISQSHLTTQVSATSRDVGEKVGVLHERLGKLDEEIRHLQEMGKDLRSLQDVLRAPKVRGGLGEQLLENLLANILASSDYRIQHAFLNGEKVDAVIRLPGGLVPVDAKFPLENFRRILCGGGDEEVRRARRSFLDDVRRHGRAIAAKYIRPSEGTLDLALMYVPAENVFYEAFVQGEGAQGSGDLWAEMLALRVFPVSPNTFALYLSTLQMGLRGLRIEEGARRILEGISTLKGDLAAFRDSFELLGKHLVNAGRNLEDARRRIERVEWTLEQVESPEAEADPAELVPGAARTGSA